MITQSVSVPAKDQDKLAGPATTELTRWDRVVSRINPRLRVQQVLVFGSLLLLWEGVVFLGLIDVFWVSRPSLVWDNLWGLISTGEIVRHLNATLQATFMGFGIGLVTGIVAGALLGYFKTLSDLFDPLVMALYSLPRVALAPLFILYFGIGISSKVALAVTLCFFLVLISTRAGVRGVDQHLINAVKTMGAGKPFILRRVVLPATVPWIISGARNGVIFSLMAVVVGEMLIARAGLGRLVTQASDTFNTTGVFAVLVVMGAIAISLNWGLGIIERRTERYSTARR